MFGSSLSPPTVSPSLRFGTESLAASLHLGFGTAFPTPRSNTHTSLTATSSLGSPLTNFPFRSYAAYVCLDSNRTVNCANSTLRSFALGATIRP